MARKKTAATKSTEVAEVEERALTSSVDLSDQFANDSGAGTENLTQDDLAIPYLTILQSNSPQLKRSDGAYVEDAVEGDFYNSVLEDVHHGELYIIPCAYQKMLVEWVPRDQGGGLVAQHSPESTVAKAAKEANVRDSAGRLMSADGKHMMVDTAYHFVLYYADESNGWLTAVISMTSTQLKASRKWNSHITSRMVDTSSGRVQAPSFAQVFLAYSVPQSNDKGSWMGWKIEPHALVDDADLYAQAREFSQLVRSGAVRASVEEPVETTSNDDSGVI